ncbi:MAG: type I 3-dehydroquinate dehydratase [Methylacidiphilales bacterium]|nr:type I 3-dehydroquinate dehydratase [Candidatus Methylacidiphilales bacterium]MDW8349640.1 type I 3-dehydroquinate dehydratase [Verrucomicrobiae bacterium]
MKASSSAPLASEAQLKYRLRSIHAPLRVACLSAPSTLKRLPHIHKNHKFPVDLIEIRLDFLLKNGLSFDSLTSQLSSILKNTSIPILLTPRHPHEGGQWRWRSHTERMDLAFTLLPYASAIDLELAYLEPLQPLLKSIRKSNVALCLSAHFLKKPLSLSQIQKLTNQFTEARPDLAKIAALARSPHELSILCYPLIHAPKLPWALMATGPQALLTRVTLASLGSKLIYGYLDHPTAPGQPSIYQVNQILKNLAPLFLPPSA